MQTTLTFPISAIIRVNGVAVRAAVGGRPGRVSPQYPKLPR
jgi:hypothetical protein